jgi:hypothetical protein
MAFFSKESVLMLSAFTKFPHPIQGTLNITTSALQHLSVSPKLSFRAVKDKIKYSVHCTSSLRILSLQDIIQGTLGELYTGYNFKVKGDFISSVEKESNTEIFMGSGQLIDGAELIQPSGEHGDNSHLFMFPASTDTLCDEADIIFGVQNANGPLVPDIKYIQSLIDTGMNRVIFATVSGLLVFTMTDKTLLQASMDIYRNLVYDIQYMAFIGLNSTALNYTQHYTIYRLCRNAVAVCAEQNLTSITSVCNALGTIGDNSKFVNNTSAYFLADSLLHFQAVNIDYQTLLETLQNTFGKKIEVKPQPLFKWQNPEYVCKITIAIVMGTDPGSVDFRQNFLEKKGQVGIALFLTSAPLREILPGEVVNHPMEQLKAIVVDSIHSFFDSVDMSSLSSAQEAYSQIQGDALQNKLEQSKLYKDDVAVSIVMRIQQNTGTLIQMPDSKVTLLPPYAISRQEPRVSILIDLLPDLGIDGNFTPWEKAFVSGASVT